MHKRLLLAAGGAIGVGILGWYQIGSRSAPNRIAPAGSAATPSDTIASPEPDLSVALRADAWTRIPLTQSDQQNLARAIHDAAKAYFSDSFPDWQRWHEANPIALGAPQSVMTEEQWKSQIRLLRNSQANWSGARLAHGASRLAVAPIRSDQTKAVATRSEPMVENGGTSDLDALKVELQVPLAVQSRVGGSIERVYGMTFQKRRSDGKWILTGHSFVGPSNQGFVIPP